MPRHCTRLGAFLPEAASCIIYSTDRRADMADTMHGVVRYRPRPDRTAGKARWRGLLIGIGVVLAALSGCQRGPSDSGPVVEERPYVSFQAPVFEALSLEGRPVDLRDYRGKVVMLNFWATWCIPCRVEMPSMQALYEQYSEKGFEILAISGGEPEGRIRPFVDELGLTFPILLDPQFQIHQRYQVTAIPSTYVINPQGVIVHRLFGATDWNTAESHALVASLIQGDSRGTP